MQGNGNRGADGIRHYATAGLDGDANAALRSMMDVLRGRTRAEWIGGDCQQADVVFLGAQGAAPPARTPSRHIIRVVRHGEGNAGYAHRIDYPFRVFQLLSVMQEVEDEGAAAGESAGAPASHPSWALFDALHRLAGDSGTGRWLCTRGEAEGAELFVRDDLQEFAVTPEMEEALAAARLPHAPLSPSAPPPATLRRPDAARLLWCVGLHAGRGQLSGTLEASVPYRLRAWPDFGRLRAGRDHLRLSALLAAEAYRRDELAAHLAGDRAENTERVNRFLNACAASGLLRAEHRDAPPAAARPPAGGFVGSLVSRLRSRLGFGARLAHGH